MKKEKNMTKDKKEGNFVEDKNLKEKIDNTINLVEEAILEEELTEENKAILDQLRNLKEKRQTRTEEEG